MGTVITSSEIRDFVDGYMDCALWASNNPDTETPLDKDWEVCDFTSNACERSVYECMEFFAANEVDLTWYFRCRDIPLVETAEEYAGHDFWLTRNHHGAGFWDREAGQAGDNLSSAAEKYGEANVWISSDGLEIE